MFVLVNDPHAQTVKIGSGFNLLAMPRNGSTITHWVGMGPMGLWAGTQLWALITSRSDMDQRVLQTLQNTLPAIESVLRLGGTMPSRFTLHDQDHAFRVAERMFELLPPSMLDNASDTELALLLLSAYLHDVGMTPEQSLADRHWKHILLGPTIALEPGEAAALQHWLDVEYSGLVPPIIKGPLTEAGLHLQEEVFAYYCRHKHNDWSELWIREHLVSSDWGLYFGWTEDLITLCRSHHEDLPELRQSRFDARHTGSPSRQVNLRYLAAILRIADVLEFDPERTPDVILRHRAIPAGSRIYWSKDHSVSFNLDKQQRRMLLSARTPNAAVHHAVLKTAEMVDAELACCSTLEQEGAYRLGKISNRDYYEWPWAAKLGVDVVARDQSFTYIDGAFRPNVSRILTLLSGTSLYGNPFAAIRELLQNATDAVREQIAHERLERPDAKNPAIATALGALHKIRLTVEKRGEEVWLRCSDDGVGMTKDIIERHLLVSGSGTRSDVRALERRAQAQGFSTGRTGQFGIGLLSYFMIGDRVEITSRRSAEAGDVDASAWHFVTEGVGTFGQLQRASRSAKGTEVSIRIKAEIVADDDFYSSVLGYVKHVLRRVPCHIEVADASGGGKTWQCGPGWTSDEPKLVSLRQRQHSQLQTFEEMAEWQRHDELRERAANAMAQNILRYGPHEFEIPSVGPARMWISYFLLGEGACVTFFNRDDDKLVLVPPEHAAALVPPSELILSFRGFFVDSPTIAINEYFGCVALEIDALEGMITVDRNQLSLILLRSQTFARTSLIFSLPNS